MKQIVASAVLALGLFATASKAEARPSPTMPGSASVELVSGGCGPRGHRGYYGHCRPNRPPPRAYMRCPPAYHPTPYGCRRNF